MSAKDEVLVAIPKTSLCRGCKKTGKHLRPDGKVTCDAVKKPVEPIDRNQYGRYELCPNRIDVLPTHALQLLAKYARSLKVRGLEDFNDKIDTAREKIRADLQITLRIR